VAALVQRRRCLLPSLPLLSKFIMAPPTLARLARLRRVAADSDTAFLFAGGADALHDVASRGFLEYALPPFVAADPEAVLLITPSTVVVHCSAAAWAGALQPVLDDDALLPEGETLGELHAHVPDAQLAGEEAHLDFKLEAAGAMLERARREASSVLAGATALEAALGTWPLLRAATLHTPLPTQPGADGAATAALLRLSRAVCSVDAAALLPDGWAGCGVAAVCAGWSALSSKLCSLEDAYDRNELSEKGLSDLALKATAKHAASAAPGKTTPTAEALAESGVAGVWAGVRSSKCGLEAPRKRPLRMSGPSNTPCLHAIVRLSDPSGSGMAVGRTIFLSNGRVPHHWQHRVFSDGCATPLRARSASPRGLSPLHVGCRRCTLAVAAARGLSPLHVGCRRCTLAVAAARWLSPLHVGCRRRPAARTPPRCPCAAATARRLRLPRRSPRRSPRDRPVSAHACAHCTRTRTRRRVHDGHDDLMM
jgi:hypothetical protein